MSKQSLRVTLLRELKREMLKVEAANLEDTYEYEERESLKKLIADVRKAKTINRLCNIYGREFVLELALEIMGLD